MKKQDCEWISPEKFFASQDRHELKRYWQSKEGLKMKQQLKSVEMARQPATSYLANHREVEEPVSTRLSPQEYYSTPEGKRKRELKKLDANAHRSVDMTPRLNKGTTNTPKESTKALTSRTSTSKNPPCKECGGYVRPRIRNGFCGANCRMKVNRRIEKEKRRIEEEQLRNQVSLDDFLKLQALVMDTRSELLTLQKRVAKAGYDDTENHGQDAGSDRDADMDVLMNADDPYAGTPY